MRIFSLAFLLGIILLQQFSHLPAPKWIWIILSLVIFLLPLRRYLFIPIAFALGFGWCLWFAHSQLSWELPNHIEGETITAIGYIDSIPSHSIHSASFIFKLRKIQFENETQSAHCLVKLSWQGKNVPENLYVGDKWQLTVRLKKIHGMMNPGGFDYEAWAVQEGVRAKGYIVVKNAENKLLSSHWYHAPINRIRQFIKEKINTNLPYSNTSPWITALVVGERNNISQANWEVLRNTGTNHLMAIAGLHIGFMSGFVFAFVAWIWRRIPRLVLKLPAQHAGAIAALCMALMYSAMAGFSLPTQRACFMLSVFLIILLMRRKILAWHAWSIALLGVLFINPLIVLSESFWLSFGAVALIIYGASGRLSAHSLWWKWGRIQWVIGIGLIPFSIWLFQQCSLVSFAANSIAIPCVGFLIVPLCLLGSFLLVFSSKLGTFILILADKILAVLWKILTWFAHFSWASWYQVMPNHWVLLAACIGVIFLLLPRGFPGRFFGVIWLLPLFFYQAPTPKLGEVWFTLLDVGQGLSAVVQTKHHFLIFDTGPKLNPSYDMGESVVVPFLQANHAKKVDMLVISHGDNDHIGGARAILKKFPVGMIKTSVPYELPSSTTSYCFGGENWDWDQIHFEFLYPNPDNLGFDNDSSCVLRVTAGDKHVLLTGDIEKYAEAKLVETESNKLSANILVAPHHGSKTSAEDDFLQNVNPKFVLFPIGYRNRYHFPHELVIEKYDAMNTKKYDSATGGAIQFLIIPNENIQDPTLYREINKHYWNS